MLSDAVTSARSVSARLNRAREGERPEIDEGERKQDIEAKTNDVTPTDGGMGKRDEGRSVCDDVQRLFAASFSPRRRQRDALLLDAQTTLRPLLGFAGRRQGVGPSTR